MPFEGEDTELAYLDYLAEHESGFLGGIPVQLIGMEEALSDIETLIAPRRFNPSSWRHRRVTTMAKKGKSKKPVSSKKADKAALRQAKKDAKAKARRDKKVNRLRKQIGRLEKKVEKAEGKIAKLMGPEVGKKK